jgi:methionyl-tRNA formyltransferase
MKQLKIIFIGTPDFGIASLDKLNADKHFNIIGVVTQPDKKIGRKQLLTPPPIKQRAIELNLPVFQPKNIAEFESEMIELKPDLAIVIAYAQIIPSSILSIPKFGFINVHGSLLPKYRGAACIQSSILNNDNETGISIMKMDKNLDTGPIIAQAKLLINDNDTTEMLYAKLSKIGAELLIPSIKDYCENIIQPIAQNNALATYVKTLKKSDGHIDWKKSSNELERFVRAMSSWPGAFAYFPLPDNKLQTIKIIKTATVVLSDNNYQPGEIFKQSNKLFIKCGQGALQILEVQLAGKKAISGEDFLKGYKNLIGIKLC